MTQKTQITETIKPLKISRIFKAPPALVFSAWGSAAHIKNWFCPEALTIPQATVEFKQGGIFAITMQGPDGTLYPASGHFIEISPPQRLVFTLNVINQNKMLFAAHTTVTFEPVNGDTRMSVIQRYEIFDEAALQQTKGAEEGWASTLNHLEKYLASTQSNPAVVHDSFTIERTYSATPETIFHALTNLTAKAKWFDATEGCTVLERSMDVSPGGREQLKGKWPNGTTHCFDAIYLDIIENHRLVYVYEMHLDDKKISASLATIQLHQTSRGTKLTLTEQGAFLDGYDDSGSREAGTNQLLDQLGNSLAA